MNKKKIIIACLLICVILSLKSQSIFSVKTGVSYIEHYTIGIGIHITESNELSLNYGSDFFINPQNSSSYFFQYAYLFRRFAFEKFTPKAGLKGGYSIYSNKYYRWELLVGVPYVGFDYLVRKKLDLFCDVGMVLSRELSMTRISLGEIGWYKRVLPEIKIGFSYNL
ncbi:MAG: hypothetical protein PF517_21170 [Salinivirgaceae bacterium]|jgi:hypothetical protein|nr:hypothetical protein [Salinivirgaceae bacterium]